MRLYLAIAMLMAMPSCSAFVVSLRGGNIPLPRGQRGAVSGFATTRAATSAARLTGAKAGRRTMMSGGGGGLDSPTFVILPGFGNADVDYGETIPDSGSGAFVLKPHLPWLLQKCLGNRDS